MNIADEGKIVGGEESRPQDWDLNPETGIGAATAPALAAAKGPPGLPTAIAADPLVKRDPEIAHSPSGAPLPLATAADPTNRPVATTGTVELVRPTGAIASDLVRAAPASTIAAVDETRRDAVGATLQTGARSTTGAPLQASGAPARQSVLKPPFVAPIKPTTAPASGAAPSVPPAVAARAAAMVKEAADRKAQDAAAGIGPEVPSAVASKAERLAAKPVLGTADKPAQTTSSTDEAAPGPASVSASDVPMQAMAFHDIGGGMVQVRYLDRDGTDHHADVPSNAPAFRAFQDVIHQYWRDMQGVASAYAGVHPVGKQPLA